MPRLGVTPPADALLAAQRIDLFHLELALENPILQHQSSRVQEATMKPATYEVGGMPTDPVVVGRDSPQEHRTLRICDGV